jgi:hypothetical protein
MTRIGTKLKVGTAAGAIAVAASLTLVAPAAATPVVPAPAAPVFSGPSDVPLWFGWGRSHDILKFKPQPFKFFNFFLFGCYPKPR